MELTSEAGLTGQKLSPGMANLRSGSRTSAALCGAFTGQTGPRCHGTMGMFDTAIARVECPECGLRATRKVPFKHSGHRMETYELGDLVQGAPAGQPLVRTRFTCSGTTSDRTDEHGGGRNEEERVPSEAGEQGVPGGEHRVEC